MKVFKICKAVCLFTAIVALISVMCACSSSKTDNLRDDFLKFHSEKFERNRIYTESNTPIDALSLYKEESNHEPKVLFSVIISTGEERYKWLQLSNDERKNELKELSNLVIEYARESKWNNDYYLLVDVSDIYGSSDIVYDYERDVIWIPNDEQVYLTMYEKFHTFFNHDLESTQEGIDYLVKNKIAYIQHGEVEYYNDFGYTVYIHDGVYSSFGQDKSTAY